MNFIKSFTITALTLTSLLLGLIYAVDPYDKYQINVFGFETKAVAMARENKFNMIEHGQKKYEAFIIGSSSAHRMHTEDVEKLTGLETFNYAVQHTAPDDYLAIVRHVMSKHHPKLILLQIDFDSLNINYPTDTRFYTSPLKPFLVAADTYQEQRQPMFDSDYFTLAAIGDSFKVIWVNLFGKVRHLYLADGNYHKEKPHEGPISINQFGYPDYTISQERMRFLHTIKEIADKNQVQLIVWTAPTSYEHTMRILNDPDLSAKFSLFKESLVEVFGTVYDFANPGVASYNQASYFRDSNHPTREFFQLLLQRILGPQSDQFPPQFGEKLTTKKK
jgi:hypothetical protein